MSISTHVLDTSLGRPAVDVAVTLEVEQGGAWLVIGQARTDANGRVAAFAPGTLTTTGVFRLRFASGEYFQARGAPSFYPFIEVTFRVEQPDAHYHVPLLLAAHGYSTYRGS